MPLNSNQKADQAMGALMDATTRMLAPVKRQRLGYVLEDKRYAFECLGNEVVIYRKSNGEWILGFDYHENICDDNILDVTSEAEVKLEEWQEKVLA